MRSRLLSPAPFWRRLSSTLTSSACALALLAAAPILVLSPAEALALPPSGASPGDVQRATHHYTRGTELFKANRFDAALEEFRTSHQIVASPNSHLYIARCLAALGQLRAAWLDYDRTATEASTAGAKYTQTGITAAQERDDLSAKIALVAVIPQNVSPGATVRVGAYDVPSERYGQPFPLEPGSFDVVLQVPGGAPTVKHITVRAGERRDLIIRPGGGDVPVGPVVVNTDAGSGGSKLNGLRIGAIAATTVGVVGFVIFAVEGSASKSTYSSIQSECKDMLGCAGASTATRSNVTSQISSGKSQQTIANVGVAVGAVGLAAGATLFALSFRRPSPSSTGLVVGPGYIGASGSF